MTSYKPLWHLLIEKDLKKKDLQKIANISSNTITRMSRGDEVSLTVINKICSALNCSYEDVLSYVPDDNDI